LVLSVISCLPPSILSRKHPLFISKAKPKDYKTMVVLQKGGGYGRFFLFLSLSSKTSLQKL